ncbi:MAG: hypothetical protein CYPHOPRED_002322 [Cyphobasidiales sp. Tagirdzhanova-0007]|nr:MAG: hypothetical protein CYPHOPRED_002322 [Cyphobasidiales sp. Tagirdzhanova-0007]
MVRPSGRHTGITDLPLTSKGESDIEALAERVVGKGRLLDPDLLSLVLISPRQRACKTYDLLFLHLSEGQRPKKVSIDESVREWDYGQCEGALASDVNAKRKAEGEKLWDIWMDGCPGGESPEEMTARVDEVVQHIQKLHREWMSRDNAQADDKGGDVLVLSHGHFSRVFMARWIGLPIAQGQLFTVDVGGVSIGQYYHTLDKTCIGALNAGSF